MLTADEIRSRTFLVALRGYDRDEVKAFLVQVGELVGDLQERLRELEKRPAQPGESGVPAETGAPGPAPAAAETSPFAELGRETQRILEAAQAAAEDIRRRAREDADRELKAARTQATRIIAEGERRREETERVVDALTGARTDLSEDLRAVGRTIERMLRELAPEPGSATVREALTAAAREDGSPAATAPVGDEDAAPAAELPPLAGDAEADEQFLPADGAEREAPAAAPARPGEGTGERTTPLEDRGGVAVEDDGGVAVEDDGASPAGANPAAQRSAAEEVLDAEPAGDATPSQVRRARALGPLHPRLVRRLKRGLQDLQNATRDALRRDPERKDVEPFLPDAAAMRSLAAMAAEHLRQAHAAGLAAGSEVVGVEIDVQASASALADQLGSELGGVLVTRLAEALRAGFDEGEAMPVLTQRVDAVFAKIKDGPAGDVAAVALVRAYEGGQKDAWAAAGVSHRRWVRGVEPPCTDPRCVDNESVGPVPLEERFPSRHDAPPVRPGCSCSTAPGEGE